MKNQNKKSRRINRKQTKRKTIKRKQTKRKQNKKIVYNRKKMYGGKFGENDEERLKNFLKEKYSFSDKKLKKVMTILSLGSQCFSGDEKIFQLESQIDAYPNRKDFMNWLKDEGPEGYKEVAYACDDTDSEDDDDDF